MICAADFPLVAEMLSFPFIGRQQLWFVNADSCFLGGGCVSWCFPLLAPVVFFRFFSGSAKWSWTFFSHGCTSDWFSLALVLLWSVSYSQFVFCSPLWLRFNLVIDFVDWFPQPLVRNLVSSWVDLVLSALCHGNDYEASDMC